MIILLFVAACTTKDRTVDCLEGVSEHRYTDHQQGSYLVIQKNKSHLSFLFKDDKGVDTAVDFEILRDGNMISIANLSVPAKLSTHNSGSNNRCRWTRSLSRAGLGEMKKIVEVRCTRKFSAIDLEVVIEDGKGIIRWSTVLDGKNISDYALQGDVGLLKNCIQFE